MSAVLLDAQSHGNFTLTHQANERSNDGPTEHPKVLKTSWHWDPHLGYVCHEVSEDWKVWFFLEFADDIQFCTLLCTFNYLCSSYMELKRVEKKFWSKDVKFCKRLPFQGQLTLCPARFSFWRIKCFELLTICSSPDSVLSRTYVLYLWAKRFWSADLNFGPDPVKPGDNDKLCNAEIEDRGASVVI